MTTKQDLIAELKEKEKEIVILIKGCKEKYWVSSEDEHNETPLMCGNKGYYCESCSYIIGVYKAEITALKKGIDACDDLIKKEIEFLNTLLVVSEATQLDFIKKELEQLKAEENSKQ